VLLRISESVIWQETDQGVSLYHLDTGDFLTLNDTGTQIWLLLAGNGDVESVIIKLSLLFDGARYALDARIRADVEEFVNTMAGNGLLVDAAA
jgi:hypothetical protein